MAICTRAPEATEKVCCGPPTTATTGSAAAFFSKVKAVVSRTGRGEEEPQHKGQRGKESASSTRLCYIRLTLACSAGKALSCSACSGTLLKFLNTLLPCLLLLPPLAPSHEVTSRETE